ncbi:sulfotransferase family protein [Micromonospora sp. SL1-18]|uniref:sulfotransferase family protein n=1 Tax=Micromonospora sp. SL1-18 TaxID=3399128 RepID=UPI003A4D7470
MPEPTDPRPSLKVIGVGYGRTGTASMKVALERLGFGPCCHMTEVMEQPELVRRWRRIADGGGADWESVLGGYGATVDWPGAAYWRELVDAYPDAKILLTVRDPKRWYQSALNTIFKFPMRRRNLAERLLFTVVRWANPSSAQVPLLLDRVLWNRVFDGRPFNGRTFPDGVPDQEYATGSFNRHNEEVKAYVPADRLLVYNVAEGWAPLCAFLGVPVPDEPFPRLNETDSFNRMIAARVRSAIVPVAAALTATLGVVAALVYGVAALTLG